MGQQAVTVKKSEKMAKNEHVQPKCGRKPVKAGRLQNHVDYCMTCQRLLRQDQG